MPIINRNAAGIDLSGDVSHFVALEIGDELEVREFGGMTVGQFQADMISFPQAPHVILESLLFVTVALVESTPPETKRPALLSEAKMFQKGRVF
jgi:hypothetical protein